MDPKPNSEPIGRRTRLQRTLRSEKTMKENKQARIAARRRFLEAKAAKENGFGYISCSDNDNDNDDDVIENNGGLEEAVVIDEQEFLKGIRYLGSDDDNADDGGNCNREKGKGVMNDDETWFESDDSLQILGERWNPLDVCDNESDDDDNLEGDNGGCPLLTDGKDEDKPGTSGVKEVEFSDLESSSSEETDGDVSDCDFHVENPEISENSGLLSSDDDPEEKGEENSGEKKRGQPPLPKKSDPTPRKKQKEDVVVVQIPNTKQYVVLDTTPGKRPRVLHTIEEEEEENVVVLGQNPPKKQYVVLDAMPQKKPVVLDTIQEEENVGLTPIPQKKQEEVALDTMSRKRPVVEEEEREVVVVLGQMAQKKQEAVFPRRKKPKVLDTTPRKEEEEEEENVVLDTTPQKEDVVLDTSMTKQKKKRLKVKDVEDVLLNTILENGNAAVLDGTDPSTNDEEDLLRKFSYGVEKKLVPEKTPYEEDVEGLFKELDFGLGVCDIGLQASCLYDNEEEDVLCDSAISQEKLCREGKHYLILDDEIGIKCKFCSVVVVEIRDITPAFNDNPFGRSVNSSCGRFPHDHNSGSEGYQFPDLDHDSGAANDEEIEDTRGTVWDLIPGTKRTLYEHQQKGFEFIWTNIAGGIKIDELGKPSEVGLGGCIICHAPGTGKTRLALVFLQSYLKKYPMSKPVIIAPSSMLLTWDEQFVRWQVDVPFINLNSPELSRKEIEVLKCVNNFKQSKAIRKAKLCIWAMGKGVLGISYTMFEKLAGERKGTDELIRKALLEQSGILVLDEGHTPRNEESNIWKVFSDVKTKKRIILSGTPFQNNFVELNNTLSLIREEFGDPFMRGNHVQSGRKSKTNRRGGFFKDTSKVGDERRIQDLRNRLKPFVHVHKGEILRKTLRGLFHSVLFLKPSELQKSNIRQLAGVKTGLSLDYLVSIASVHPSLLYKCEQVPDFVDKKLLQIYNTDLDVGVKIKFLFELIKLSKGEKVLVFSQFLIPLTFIADLLKAHFNWTEGSEYLFMEGKQSPKIRQSLIGQFNVPESATRVLLASTKACCEGIHLVGASRVVLLDVVWNPSVERQAISRAYRLGQKKDVYVYHLITAGTLEREKYDRQVAKELVSEQVFISSEGEGGLNTLSGISEDRILEEMIQHEKLKNMFEKIIYEPKAHSS